MAEKGEYSSKDPRRIDFRDALEGLTPKPPHPRGESSNLQLPPTGNDGSPWWTEVNFQRLPIAVLSEKTAGSPNATIEIDRTVTQDGKQARAYWKVSPNAELGIAGPTSLVAWRALEQLVLRRTVAKGRELTCPQTFGLRELCDLIGLTKQGANTRRLKRDLRRIRDATYMEENMFREKRASKEGRPRNRARRRVGIRGHSAFSLITRMVFFSEQFEDGRIADTNYVWFDPFYVRSANSGYIKPLDWKLWLSLKPIAQRLYELMDLKMWSTPHAPFIQFDYDYELVPFLPVKRQKYLGNAQTSFSDSLSQLVSKGLIESKKVKGRREHSQCWQKDGTFWSLRLTPSEAYRNAILARKNPKFDSRALWLAKELRDPGSLKMYQLVVTSVDWQWISIALSETKTSAEHDRKIKRGAYFTGALSRILEHRGIPTTWKSS